jgi:hypothetical protein
MRLLVLVAAKERIRFRAPKLFARLKKLRALTRGRFLKIRAFFKGRYPRALAEFLLRQGARNPQTFNQKMKYKMLHDRRALLTTISDKVAVRAYVADKVGEKYLPEVFALWRPGEAIDWNKLPNQYVAKSTHGSGGSIIVWDGAPNQELPTPTKHENWGIYLVPPKNINLQKVEALFSKWTSQNFEYGFGRNPEWSYRDIVPRILFEELLLTADGEIPKDFKFLCFDGVCQLIEVDSNRFRNYTRDLYAPDWQPIPTRLVTPNSAKQIDKPENLAEMIELAEALSAGLDFVSVDMYNIGGRIVFGEMTNCPGGSVEKFSSKSLEEWLGSIWNLPGDYSAIHLVEGENPNNRGK